MAYVLPVFNLTVGIWRHGNAHSNPPDVTVLGNLSPGRVVGVDSTVPSGDNLGIGGMWLRLPVGTDVRDAKAPAGADTVEIDLGSGRFYDVVWVDDIGGGFTNEHRFAFCQGVGPWPVPFPRPPAVAPPPGPPLPTLLLAFTGGNSPQVSLDIGSLTTDGDMLWFIFTSNPTFVPAVFDGVGGRWDPTDVGGYALYPVPEDLGSGGLWAVYVPGPPNPFNDYSIEVDNGNSDYCHGVIVALHGTSLVTIQDDEETASSGVPAIMFYTPTASPPLINLFCAEVNNTFAGPVASPFTFLGGQTDNFSIYGFQMTVGYYLDTLGTVNIGSLTNDGSPGWGAIQLEYAV